MGEIVGLCAGTNTTILPANKVTGILVNVPHNGINDKAIADTNLMFDYAGCKYRFLDTGGWQNSQAEKNGTEIRYDVSKPLECTKTVLNLTLQHVINVMVNMNITIANALDFPIKAKGNDGENEYEFMKKLGFNMLWARESLELRNKYCPDVELFLPIQCYNLEQLEKFLGVLGDSEFDGYSIPPRNFSTKELVLFLLQFKKLGIKKVHLLGTTEFFTIALAAYMARHHFDFVSLDATTWREAAQHGQFLNQHDLTNEKIYNVFIDEDIQNDCPCPFCKGETFTSIKELPQTDRINHLRCHNFWVIEKAIKDLYDNSVTIMSLEKFLKRKSSDLRKIKELVDTLSLMEFYMNEDITLLQNHLLL